MSENMVVAVVAGALGAGGTLLGVLAQGLVEHMKTRGSLRRCNLDRLSDKQFEFYTSMASHTAALTIWAVTLYSDVLRQAGGRPPIERPKGATLKELLNDLSLSMIANSLFIPRIVSDALHELSRAGTECMEHLTQETADKFVSRCFDASDTMRKCIGVDRLHVDLMRSLRERDAATLSGPLLPNTVGKQACSLSCPDRPDERTRHCPTAAVARQPASPPAMDIGGRSL